MEFGTSASRKWTSTRSHGRTFPMRKRWLSIALVAVPTLLIGGAAYAAAQAVSSTPDSQVVIPSTSTTFDDHGNDRATTPSTVDDHGNDAVTTPSTVDDH